MYYYMGPNWAAAVHAWGLYCSSLFVWNLDSNRFPRVVSELKLRKNWPEVDMWIELNIVNTSNDDCLFSFVGKSEPTMFYCASSAVADRVSEGAVTDAGRRVHSTQAVSYTHLTLPTNREV